MNNPKIKLNEAGWYWPVADQNDSCWNYTNQRLDTPQKIAKYVKNFDTCLHAGANCGFYAKQYANLFHNVYLFEPEPTNFTCLNLNVQEQNAYKIQSFLGNEHKLFNIELSGDIGGHNLGKNPQSGNIPMLRIDDLNLNSCGLIHLDVEGYEPQVIMGGKETIEKFKPVIVVEIAWSDSTNLLEYLGYNKIGQENDDWVFLPK